MKKLLMLFAAVFAISATSFAQVEAIPAETEPSVKMKKRGVRTAENTKQIPRNMRTPSTPEERTARIVNRVNERLIAKDPKLALTEEQRAQLIEIHMERQLIQQARPKLETEQDKADFIASRKAASKKFKEKLNSILTDEQNAAYMDAKRDKKAIKATKKAKKSVKRTETKEIEKSKF